MASRRRNPWFIWSWVVAVVSVVAQIVMATAWGLPWFIAVIFAASVLVQGFLIGSTWSYRKGLDDGSRIQRDVTKEIQLAMPMIAAEQYTRAVTRRDRVN